MFVVKTPLDKTFNYTECEELYDKYKEQIKDYDFDRILRDTFFYSAHDWKTGKLLGCIYYFNKNGRMYVNAFGSRGHHQENLNFFNKTLGWFNCDIYAEATEKTSRLCVLRCGFKRLKDNLFIYRRKK